MHIALAKAALVLGLNAWRERQMMKTSERSNDGRKKMKAIGEIFLTLMDRWINFVEIMEMQIKEKQSCVKVADILNKVARKST
jgi:hypothetical protein